MTLTLLSISACADTIIVENHIGNFYFEVFYIESKLKSLKYLEIYKAL